jgi:hypothetical protein
MPITLSGENPAAVAQGEVHGLGLQNRDGGAFLWRRSRPLHQILSMLPTPTQFHVLLWQSLRLAINKIIHHDDIYVVAQDLSTEG